jgi:uncharacterized membrane protein (DUF4010 family)
VFGIQVNRGITFHIYEASDSMSDTTDLTEIFAHLAISLGLGMLIGLQRERTGGRLAGLRTFPLVSLSGSLCAMLAPSFGGWILAAGFVGVAGVVLIGMRTEQEADHDPGITSEIAILLVFVLGAYVMAGDHMVAIAVGGVTAVLLQFKVQMHGWASKLGDEDLKAIMKFVLIALVILPVLPDRNYGPFAALNPRQIWWMVVLIVGISLAGYICFKFLGQGAGTLLAGILGGFISSTATTVSYARRAKKEPQTSSTAAIVILVASSILFARLLLVIGIVDPVFLKAAAPPLTAMLLISAVLAIVAWLTERRKKIEVSLQENPAELKAALVFGLLFAVVLFIVAVVQRNFGNRGLYMVAGVSGLTDVDAITLSAVKLVGERGLAADTAWRVIILASISNLAFKGGAVAVLGNRDLFLRILFLFGIVFVAGLLLLLLWPS